MAWLARLDARAARWPRPVRWPYLSLKYLLITLGVYLAIGSAYMEFTEGRLGIGLGICTTMFLAAIGGVLDALSGNTPDSSSGPIPPSPTAP